MNSIWGLGLAMVTKCIVVVDHDGAVRGSTSNGSITLNLISGCMGPLDLGTSNGSVTITVGADFAGQSLQLLDRRRPVDIGTDDQNLLFLLLLQKAGKLGNRGSFTRALQTGHQDHSGRLRRQVQPLVCLPHDLAQLALNNL